MDNGVGGWMDRWMDRLMVKELVQENTREPSIQGLEEEGRS